MSSVISRTCTACGCAIPPERLAVLPEAVTCVKCSSQRDTRYRGAVLYEHKTAGSLAVFADATSFQHFKGLTDRKGQQSILRKLTPGGGRAL